MQQLVDFTSSHLLTTAIWGAVLRFTYLRYSMCSTGLHPVQQIYRGPLQRDAKHHVASNSHSTQPLTRTPLETMCVAKWHDVQRVPRACMSVLSSLHEVMVIVLISVDVPWLPPYPLFHKLVCNPTV